MGKVLPKSGQKINTIQNTLYKALSCRGVVLLLLRHRVDKKETESEGGEREREREGEREFVLKV